MSHRPATAPTDPYDASQLAADLETLVRAGLLQEVRKPGHPTRYALTSAGAAMTDPSERSPH